MVLPIPVVTEVGISACKSERKAYASGRCLLFGMRRKSYSLLQIQCSLTVRYNHSYGSNSSSSDLLFDVYVSGFLSTCPLFTIPSVQRSSYYILILMKENDASGEDSN